MSIKVYWCKNCLNMSTRPRITFDQRGWCNACQWMEEKKQMDWTPRQKELEELLDKYRSCDEKFDCIVPVSGGKDGSYISYNLKHKYGMNPLALTSRPPLTLDLGDQNLVNYIRSGYDHMHITANENAMQRLNKTGFIELGFPYYGWLLTVKTIPLRVALQFNIPLLFWGEEGDVEYGGSTEFKNKPCFDIRFTLKVYFDSGYDTVLKKSGLSEKELFWFILPSQEEVDNVNIRMAKFGYYEAWDPYRNYIVAKENCGLQEREEAGSGTFTNFAQNDQALYSLHCYMMYLKFGFGRATQDVGIEIRRGAMTREQGVNLVKLFDGHFPEEFIDIYLEYYQMERKEFDMVIDKYANKELFEKVDGYWKPKFTIDWH
ncbi:MAG: N-acetyl sugar amidotransferase [Candidatus Scalindua sp.]|jgi:N-acetyl sugar amidotransferase|nr:N-acetyl sugar amidotransferase [Candidatus Scalindua sp.]